MKPRLFIAKSVSSAWGPVDHARLFQLLPDQDLGLAQPTPGQMKPREISGRIPGDFVARPEDAAGFARYAPQQERLGLVRTLEIGEADAKPAHGLEPVFVRSTRIGIEDLVSGPEVRQALGVFAETMIGPADRDPDCGFVLRLIGERLADFGRGAVQSLEQRDAPCTGIVVGLGLAEQLVD